MRRILPLTLIAAFMVLPVKLGLLSEGFPAVAEKLDREFGDHDRPWAEDLKAGASARAANAAENPPVKRMAANMIDPAPTASVAPPAPKLCDDRAVLAVVDAQKSDLAQRSKHVVEAEAVLAATEIRAQGHVRRLSDLKHEVEALLDKRSKLQTDDLRRMVSIYQTMKPQDAARILSSMDSAIVVDVLDGMTERRSAPIIAELTDDKARDVTRIVLERRALPGDRPAPVAVSPVTPISPVSPVRPATVAN